MLVDRPMPINRDVDRANLDYVSGLKGREAREAVGFGRHESLQ